MSITVLTQHPVLACTDEVAAALDSVADVEPLFMTTGDKERAALKLEALERRGAELRLRVLATADDVAEKHGAHDVAAWFAAATRTDSAGARADVELAKAIDGRWGKVRAGLVRGVVSVPQAKVIRHALEDLPADTDPATVSSAEGLLVQYAGEFAPLPLRRIGRRILEVVAPEVAEAEEAKRLRREEEQARAKARLRFRATGEGTTRITGLVPDAVADRLKTYLEAYTSPRKAIGAPFGEEDRIPADQKYAHALAALLENLDPARLPEHGGDATTVLVTISHQQLCTDLAVAGIIDANLDQGHNMTADQVRRLACSAKIIPVVLGGKGEILDLGRSRRLFSPAQRKAIRLRDKRCRGEGCDIKAAWTQIHHLRPWSEGGNTDLDNGRCYCDHHHHLMHDPRYEYTHLPNGDTRFHRRT